MAFLSQLDVINDMLATMGESPLNAIDEDHPLVASGVRTLKTVSWREQGKGWWFNKEILSVEADADGNIFVPMDAISVDPVIPTNAFVHRGRRLYNPNGGTFTFTPGTTFSCKVVRSVPFEDLPPNAANYIGACAVLAFQVNYDGDKGKTETLKSARREAYIQLHTEHIRNVQPNLLTKGSTAEKIASLGFSGTGSLYSQ
jgi:hypothetical protein